MNEADRIAKEKARQAAAKRDRGTREARAQVQAAAQALEDEATQLVAELLVLLRDRHAVQDAEPVEVLAYRFPPLGELLGNSSKTRGGWAIGHRSWLLADGQFVDQYQRVTPFARIAGGQIGQREALDGLRALRKRYGPTEGEL